MLGTMRDNYPMGAALDPRAPYNQTKDPDPIEVDCSVCYCMSKLMPVNIENYTYEERSISLDDTNFIEEFKNDNTALGIPTLLNELQRLAEEKIELLRTEGIMLDDNDKESEKKILKQIKHYQSVLKASKDWVVDDLDVYKDD